MNRVSRILASFVYSYLKTTHLVHAESSALTKESHLPVLSTVNIISKTANKKAPYSKKHSTNFELGLY